MVLILIIHFVCYRTCHPCSDCKVRHCLPIVTSVCRRHQINFLWQDRLTSRTTCRIFINHIWKISSGSNRKNEESHALFLRRNFTLSLSVYDILQWTDRPGCVCLCVSRVPGTDWAPTSHPQPSPGRHHRHQHPYNTTATTNKLLATSSFFLIGLVGQVLSKYQERLNVFECIPGVVLRALQVHQFQNSSK